MTYDTMAATALLHPLTALPDRCLVGVSGGIDSVALIQALVAVGKHPVVLHFDHGWRAESRGDAAFVRALAKRLGLPFVTARARTSVKKTEQTARTARWDFFTRQAARLHCRDLVLAHHADDQVETFLLQLLRGSGSGARGMRPVSNRGVLTVHRPWLGVWRREIAAYAKREKLDWREDATNRDTGHRRNWLRHRLIPYLRRHVHAESPRALWRAAEILGAENEWLEEWVAAAKPHPQEERLAVKALAALPLAHARRLVRQWLIAHGVADVSFEDVEAVRGLVLNRLPAKVNLAGAKFARRRAGYLFLDS